MGVDQGVAAQGHSPPAWHQSQAVLRKYLPPTWCSSTFFLVYLKTLSLAARTWGAECQSLGGFRALEWLVRPLGASWEPIEVPHIRENIWTMIWRAQRCVRRDLLTQRGLLKNQGGVRRFQGDSLPHLILDCWLYLQYVAAYGYSA